MRSLLQKISATLCVLLGIVRACGAEAATNVQHRLILVQGAPGEEMYREQFSQWMKAWEKAGESPLASIKLIGQEAGKTNDLEELVASLKTEPLADAATLWVVLVGHGTFDGKEARFNLRGPDLTATETASLLKPFQRTVIFINTASASAPFLAKLSGTNRVIITATRSGDEQNFARLGRFLAEAVAGREADLDQDGQTSLLEAFLLASRRVAQFYSGEGRLASEHSLMDDNGDGLGTPGDWFKGVRAVKKPQGATGKVVTVDGQKAHQIHLLPSVQEQGLSVETRQKRDALELAIEQLRSRKAELKEDDYYLELEKLLLQISPLYRTNQAEPKPAVASPATQ